MIDSISHYNLWVTDQDEALEFYVGKLGLEVATDIQLEFMRWLTIQAPGKPEQQIILTALQPPIVDPGNADQAKDLLSKGLMGLVILTTPDCRATYEKLRAQGVEFVQEPTEQPYGIDCEARDPFGNSIRIGSQR